MARMPEKPGFKLLLLSYQNNTNERLNPAGQVSMQWYRSTSSWIVACWWEWIVRGAGRAHQQPALAMLYTDRHSHYIIWITAFITQRPERTSFSWSNNFRCLLDEGAAGLFSHWGIYCSRVFEWRNSTRPLVSMCVAMCLGARLQNSVMFWLMMSPWAGALCRSDIYTLFELVHSMLIT